MRKPTSDLDHPWHHEPLRTRGRELRIAGALALLLLAGLELCLRSAGFVPHHTSFARWHRELADTGPDDLVIVGSSRELAGIDLQTLSAGTPTPIRQLAMSNGNSLLLLEYILRTRPDYRGVVLAGVTPGSDFTGWTDPMVQEALAWQDTAGPSERLESALQDRLGLALVLRRQSFSPSFVLAAATHPLRHLALDELHIGVLPSRQLVYGYERMAPEHVRQFADLNVQHGGSDRPPEPAEFAARSARFAAAAAELERRGGRLIAVRAPSSGAVLAGETEALPRARFWDTYVAHPGITAIYYADIDGMRLAPADHSHLGLDDARSYTRALLEQLRVLAPERFPR